MTDHLVILQSKWLSNLVSGDKTVEFRASNRRIAPYERVTPGDRLWLKASGGPVVAVAYADAVCDSGPLTRDELANIVGDLEATSLDATWAARLMTSRYVTCVSTRGVELLPQPIDVSDIRGRRQDAWQVLDTEDANAIFERYVWAIQALEEATP